MSLLAPFPDASAYALEVRRAWMFRMAREAQLILPRARDGRILTRSDVAVFLNHRVPRPATEVERYILLGIIARAEQEFACEFGRFVASERISLAQRAAMILRERFAEHWTIRRLANELRTNRFTLTTEFRERFEIGVHECLVRTRISEAQRYITAGEKVELVASGVGFRSKKSLYDAYRRVTRRPLRLRSQ